MLELDQILLVEDNLNDVELTLVALEGSNLASKVDVVNDGAEALEYLFYRGNFANRESGNPVVIILDLKLPKVDGLEVLKQIKEEPKLHLIPVVILTSSNEETDILRGYKLGANSYVVKPLEFPLFVKAIKELGSFWAILNKVPFHH
jgi:CheY-like chemotaxis protein